MGTEPMLSGARYTQRSMLHQLNAAQAGFDMVPMRPLSAAFQEYRNRIGATVEQYGGKFVVRGGRVNPKEGDWQPRHLLMLEFPSLEQAERWYNSPEYKPLIAIREKAARTQPCRMRRKMRPLAKSR